MDFKALSRTAEADVRAFASAARQRLVRNQIVSVGLAENYRFFSRLRITPRAAGLRTPARELFSVLHQPVSPIPSQTGTGRSRRVCRRDNVPWISEGVKRSRLGKTTDGSTQERLAVSPLLNGDQHPWLPDRTAHPDCSRPKKPCDPARIKPFPTTAGISEPPQLQLPPHAIHPATGHPPQ